MAVKLRKGRVDNCGYLAVGRTSGGQRWSGDVWEAEVIGERVKGAPQAPAAGIVTLDARVVATILTCRVGGQAKGLPPTSRGKEWRPWIDTITFGV